MEVPKAVINTVKMVLMSTGVVFIAILLSLALGSAAWDLPSLWSGIQGWLRPPYLYLIINGIIITIAASSRLHHNHNQVTPPPPPPHMEVETTHAAPKQMMMMMQHQQDVISVLGEPQFSPYDAVSMMAEVVNSATGSYYGVVSVQDVDVQVVGAEKLMEKKEISEVVAEEEEEEAMPVPVVENGGDDRSTTVYVERSKWSTPPPLTTSHQPLMDISPEFLSERPPASARFAHHRRPAKPSPAQAGGKALRKVAKPKKHDTLECTWKTITEGRHMPLTRHLKKSDTWEAHGRQINLLDDSFPDPVPLPVKKKSETFNGWANHAPSAVPKLKKEPSLSQDELNRRVEAFINKFNEDMRLQRQQSMQQFMEKINRAAY